MRVLIAHCSFNSFTYIILMSFIFFYDVLWPLYLRFYYYGKQLWKVINVHFCVFYDNTLRRNRGFFHVGIWSWRWTNNLLWWKLFWLSMAFIEDFIETCRSSWCAFCVNHIVNLADILTVRFNGWQSWNIRVRFHLHHFLIFWF